jgi:DNA-binding LacI/PurR family transcriptional regulator
VAPDTQKWVWDAVAELGYSPNEAGRALRGARSRLIGLIVQDVTDPYFAGVLRGGTREAWEANHIVGLLEGGGPAEVGRVVDAVRASWMSGVVACAPTPAEVDALGPILPRVLLLEYAEPAAAAEIHYDVRAGICEASSTCGTSGTTASATSRPGSMQPSSNGAPRSTTCCPAVRG